MELFIDDRSNDNRVHERARMIYREDDWGVLRNQIEVFNGNLLEVKMDRQAYYYF